MIPKRKYQTVLVPNDLTIFNQLINSLYHINLIQIYYNSVALSNTNSDEWFKFIAAITTNPYSKSYKG